MSEPTPPNEAVAEDLVAYLDGELGEAEARQVESRLNLDPRARAEAEALRRTWELLDYLPTPEPSASFTHRTLERVGPVRTQARRWRVAHPWLFASGWAAALLLSVAAGYGGMWLWYGRGPGEKDLVRDLRLIENKRLYELGEDLDFVRELDHPDLFGEETLGS